MKLLYTLVVQGIVIDRESNNVSAYNVLEQLSVKNFPLFLSVVSLVVAVRKQPGDEEKTQLDLKVSINGKILHEGAFPVNFRGLTRHRSLVTLGGLTIPSPGTLEFTTFYKGGLLGTYVIEVVNIGSPTMQRLPSGPPPRAKKDAGKGS